MTGKRGTQMAWAVVVAVLAAWASRAVAADGQPTSKPDERAILGQTSYWRWYAMDRPAVFATTAGDEVGIRKRVFGDGGKLSAAEADALAPASPADWSRPEFDDRDWPRSAGRNLAVEACGHARESEQIWAPRPMGWGNATVLVRGRFNVADPKNVRNLSVSLTVTGGAIVCVNGKKLASVGLPDGEIALHAPATPCGDDTYLDAAGKPIPASLASPRYQKRGEPKDKGLDPTAADRVEARKRNLRAAIPADMLRPGVNVVAIEVHRSDFAQAAKAWRSVYAGYQYIWPHLWIWDLSVTADPNDAVVPNVARPAGFQVWNLDRNAFAIDADFGDPTEPLRPIVLVGARNGTFSGRVVASSPTVIKGLMAEVSDLASADGKATIPAAQGMIRYSDQLDEAAPADAAVCSVWLTVRVPRDARSGVYKGTLTLKADSEKAVAVPVELSVADWMIPDPLAFKTHVGIYQSISSVALKYKVPMWSEEHWRLLERSYEMLAGLGCKFASISVVDQGMMGDEEGAVIWKKKPDGGHEYDFSTLERFLKLVKARVGQCPYIVLGIWQVADTGYSIVDSKLNPGTTVTVLDPVTGKKEHLAVPRFGTQEAEDFWKPVMLGIEALFKRLDLEPSMCLGYCHDEAPPKAVFKMFDDILGRTRWFRSGHPPDYNLEPRKISENGTNVYHEVVYTRVGRALPPIAKLLASPNLLYVRTAFPWDLMVWRTTPEWAIWNGQSGFGHIGLDFWPVSSEKSKVRIGHLDAFSVYGRFLRDNGWPGPLCPPAIAKPGKDGAAPTLPYESLREGLQEFEAAVAALDAAETRSAGIGDDLTRRAKALFAERRLVIDRGMRFKSPPSNVPDFCGWQDLSRRTFELVAEIDKALRQRGK